MLLETLPEVQALAPADKWRLMRELWEDLAPQIPDPNWDQHVFELLEKRFAEYRADPTSARPAAEVYARLEEHKKAWRQRT
jgi:putative addiction module component (TIGR02574 family)